MVDYKIIESTAKELSRIKNVDYYELLQRFMFERILERISVSKYNNNFIIKGGLLLSAMFGIDNRSTKDMDATIKGLNIDKEEMINILNEILCIDLQDGVNFDVIDITDIREDDEYGGNKYYIVGRLQNLKVNLEIDISTGDKITPRELKYKYPLIFNNKSILINTYNIETLVSEKIETILRRGIYNSRMKDFYDIYLFINKLVDDINYNNLRLAMKNTFEKRESLSYLEDYKYILSDISKNERLLSLWNKYISKNKYAQGIDFKDIVSSLEEFLDKHNVFVNN